MLIPNCFEIDERCSLRESLGKRDKRSGSPFTKLKKEKKAASSRDSSSSEDKGAAKAVKKRKKHSSGTSNDDNKPRTQDFTEELLDAPSSKNENLH